MLKENKGKLILSSAVILLPMVFGLLMWEALPDSMLTHWGADGRGDGLSAKALAVFGLPALLLLLHFLCLFFTLRDQRQRQQSRKALGIIFWILPVISLFTASVSYAAALGREPGPDLLLPVLLGGMFIILGNDLPKIRQNRTLGIKLPWTLSNEENWNRTHRFGGKLWVLGGFVLLFAGLLPLNAMVWVLLAVLLLLALLPMGYSYRLYRQHQREGIVYCTRSRSRGEKIAVRAAAVAVPVILLAVAVLMFTGNIELRCGESSFVIQADYWTDLEIGYDEIDSISCRDDFETGIRSSGFGSARLSMGRFRNEECGAYTLYAYTGAEKHILLRSGEETLVIGLREPGETEALYRLLSEKTGG